MKLLAAIALSGLCFLATTCSQSPERKQPNQSNDYSQNVLRLNLADDPNSLDPRTVRLLKDLTIVKQLFDGLMRLDSEGKPYPAVAESVEISEDLKTYTFKLRESYWSNREPVTAHDFVYSWVKVLDPAFRTDYSHMLYPIKNAKLIREGKCPVEALGVLALDDRTLVVQLEIPTPYFLELTAFPTYFPVSANLDAKYPDWANNEKKFIGNGPFILSHWIPKNELKIIKNSHYWDKDAVKMNGIVFTMVEDNNTEAELFAKNELDWLGQPISNNISTDFISYLKEKGMLQSYPIAGTLWFTFNTSIKPFDDVNLRKAFAYAINRQDIIAHILQGQQSIATSPVPHFMTMRETQFFKDADIENARSLFESYLAENKLERENFPAIVLYHTTAERTTKIAQAIQQQWQKAFGIIINLERVEPKVFRQQVRMGQFQIATGEWIADYNDPIAFLEIFKYRNESTFGNGLNDSQWQNEDYIALLEQSKIEKDPAKRLEILKAAEEILIDEMPIAPVYHFSFDYLKKDCIKNVILSPLGIADFKHAEIYR